MNSLILPLMRRPIRASLVSGILALTPACGPSENSETSSAPEQPEGAAGSASTAADPESSSPGNLSEPEVAADTPPPGYQPSTEPLSQDEFRLTFGQAICSTYARCNCSTFGTINVTSEEACVAKAIEFGAIRFYLNGQFDARALTFNEQTARDCLNDIASWDCANAGTFDLCDTIWEGTASSGESCVASIDCIGYREGTNSCMGGVCGPAEASGETGLGSSCDGTCYRSARLECSTDGLGSSTCLLNDGLTCIGGTCQAALEVGAPCDSELECTPTAVCGLPAGQCVARAEVGMPCVAALGSGCVDGAYCSGGQCVPAHEVGAACQSENWCLSGLCEGGVCTADTSGSSVCEF